MLKNQLTPDLLEEITQIQEAFATKYGCLVVLYFDGFQIPFSPRKDDPAQLVLDGFEMPKVTEFMEPGE